MGYMHTSMFEAAVKGDTSVLKGDVIAEQGEDSYHQRTDLGNNIVHIAAQQRRNSTFIEEALGKFPNLLQQKNKYGNTPLHEAAELGTKETVNVLLSHLRNIETNSTAANVVPYLLERNNEGDTPFHVALKSQNMAAAEELFAEVKDHPQILVIKNNVEETPLHLYVRYCSGGIFPGNFEHNNYQNIVDKPKLIDRLIDANPSALFEHDWEGMNPLMKAAQYGRVLLVHQILSNHTLSMECRDQKRRSFMHHLRLRMADLNARDKESTLWICEKILEIPGVDTLTFSRDQDGNTPLHLAILDRDFDFAQLILRLDYLKNNKATNYCRDSDSEDSEYGDSDLEDSIQAQLSARKELIVSINNNEGKTVFDLITFGPDIPVNLKELMERAIMGTLMNEELYLAAESGDDYILKETNFLCQATDGSNIIHIALQNGEEAFLTSAVERFPDLIYVKDSSGDTPLHVAARLRTHTAHVLLKNSLRYWSDNNRQTLCVPPWKVKNLRGNTPFHEAACTSNYKNLSVLTRFCKIHIARSEAMSDVNVAGETVLHMIARCGLDPDGLGQKESLSFYNVLAKSRIAAHMRDIDGLTPVLRAAHCGQIWAVRRISQEYPTSIQIRDYRGRRVLHHLCTSVVNDANINLFYTISNLWEKNSNINLMLSQDHDGNTPLHLAIMHQNFEVVQVFIKHYSKSSLREALMGMKNNDGKSVRNMITYGSDIPPILMKLMDQSVTEASTMDDKIYEAVAKGDTDVFDLDLNMYCKTPDGSNIIHIALRHLHFSFIKRAFKTHFRLVYSKDSKGDTPLHLAAGLQTSQALEFYKLCLTAWQSEGTCDKFLPPPWTVINSKGNTFLHEAARACNYQVISYIWAGNYKVTNGSSKFDIAGVNDQNETILHVIARYATCAAKDILDKFSEQMKSVVYVRDFEGFTPVLRAVQCGRLGVARLLVQQYPQSVAISDNKGGTALHHLRALVVDLVDDLKDILPVWKDFFKHPGVDDLRIAQNEDGNTPLHLAIIDADFTKAKFLMEKCLESENKRELVIVNNDGHLVFDLLSSQAHMTATKELQQLMSRSYVKERELMDKVMDDELYRAATKGSVRIFEKAMAETHTVIDDVENGLTKLDEDYFCRQTPGGSNIIHIALRHGNLEAEQFLTKALEHFPILSMRSDSNGDTPLHLAAKWKSGVSLVQSLIQASKAFLDKLDERNKAFHVAPWTVKNYKGSFPIHEALQTDYLKAAEALLDCDDEAAYRVNDLGETPLHAFATNGFSVNDDDADKFVKALIEKNNKAAYTRDNEGLTPLLSAARSGQFQVVRAILKHHPQSAYLRDPNGRTFLHLLRFTGEDVDESFAGTFKNTGKQLFKIPEADAQRLVQDYDGDTPLHYAIKTENSIAAIVLTQRCLESDNRTELGFMNKEGRTIPDLLALHDAPNEIIELIRKRVPEAVYLARSSYGIRKTEMKDSANALSVVAALLATITFAAGLQVPGGFDGDDGSPVLLTKPAFTVFVVANSVAMCCSMLCLFLLLWVMGIGKIHGSLMVLDISIMLIRLSFHLTLLTFTMGVFVVAAKKSLWLAIFVCGLCFLTFLLTWRYSIKLLAKYAGGAIEKSKKNVKSVGEGGDANPGIEKFGKFTKFVKSVIHG